MRQSHADAIALASFLASVLPLASAPGQEVSSAYAERAERRVAFKNRKVQAAVTAGIDWLLDHQSTDGRWDCDGFMLGHPEGQRCDGPGGAQHDVGVTALAVLALLAQADPIHDEPVRRAVDWLVKQQNRASGLVVRQIGDFVYEQAMATVAFAEAAAMFDTDRYRTAAKRALGYLESHRNPEAGWRYRPRDGNNDTSIASWCVAAYCAAHDAGLEVPPAALGEVLTWLESVTMWNGRSGYSNRGEMSARKPGDHGKKFPVMRGEAMTAAGMNIRAMCSLSPKSRLNLEAGELLLGKLPVWEESAIDFYYWFHGTEAMVAHPERSARRKWMAALHAAVLGQQRDDGAFRGSWDPVGAWGENGGRVYTTAITVLMLSSPYRRAHGDLEAMIPDREPFRRVHYLWSRGEIGAAIGKLAEIDEAALAPADIELRRRIRFYVRVHEVHGMKLVERIVQIWPLMTRQHTRLTAIAASFAGHEVGDAARKVLDVIEADPEFADEKRAMNAYARITKRAKEYSVPRSRRARQKLQKSLLEFVENYSQTQTAERARQWLGRLGR